MDFFDRLAAAASAAGIREVRMSFAQWYTKSRRRAAARSFAFVDPPAAEKVALAASLAAKAAGLGLNLTACSQPFLSAAEGIQASSCIDGRLLQALHPGREPVSQRKDRTQRTDCRCTESIDIGSYTQTCPHGCVYCYATPAGSS
jgi:hypothetical protein